MIPNLKLIAHGTLYLNLPKATLGNPKNKYFVGGVIFKIFARRSIQT